MLSVRATTGLNLARQPFANRRPIIRAAVTLWVLAALVLATDGWTWWQLRASSAEGRAELARVRAEVRAELEQARQLDGRLGLLDLGAQNEQVEFLNHKIEQRVFPWSLLFDDLAEALPERVRLLSLRPEIVAPDRRRSRRRSAPAERWVKLDINGEAERAEGILETIDALFAHPDFRSPNLRNESQQANGAVRFNLSVQYLPHEEPTVEEESTEAVAEATTSAARQSAPPQNELAPEGPGRGAGSAR